MPRATYYRLLKPPKVGGVLSIRKANSHRSLSHEEAGKVLDALHEIRFADKSPAQIYAQLLDEGKRLCSISTMYRLLRSQKEVRERRSVQSRHSYERPELLATGPNQVWSWDITKLKGPGKWDYYCLYVIIDIYSRYVVGWTLHEYESAELARTLIETSCERQKTHNSGLIIHSDRGTAMTSKTVAMLFTELGISRSLNRPHVSNDNPFSESHFKTLKYQPTFPRRFGSYLDARAFCQHFFDWYNNEHRHSGIALMTPSTVHYGRADECNDQRQMVLNKAFVRNPERFVKGLPRTLHLPEAVWINPPETKEEDSSVTISSITIIGGAK
jgi:putative transposase